MTQCACMCEVSLGFKLRPEGVQKAEKTAEISGKTFQGQAFHVPGDPAPPSLTPFCPG